ncbi:zinc finger CCCH domain-containing protein 14-like isoform X1 [Phoenix dactylifera]|uniref:Zinc finger CCCH domain-containing protein 14-like isoform X1 n=1 Tax=Phoenix dactylifera TaxID=42345 RepID=A0A8B8ZT10_PHODC|nr:zinc finger CCCH domain-containing protein 14-like isoform X1 [Phoenix dactylifera]
MPLWLWCRFRHVIVNGKYVGQQSFSSAGKPKPCMKFFSTSGCPFGESCHFLHYVPGGLSSLGLAPVISLSAALASALQKKATCPVGDPSVMVNGYKTKLCNRFNTAEGCKFGDRCHFAHGEGELRSPNNVSRGSKRPLPNGPTGTAPGFGNGGSYNFANPTGYSGPPGIISNLTAQGYVEANQPGVAGNNPGSVAYPHGNVPVF